jgi:hypothetical protein
MWGVPAKCADKVTAVTVDALFPAGTPFRIEAVRRANARHGFVDNAKSPG